jgi:hypothetical protein
VCVQAAEDLSSSGVRWSAKGRGWAYDFIHVATFAAVLFVVAYAGPWLGRSVPNLFRPEILVAALVLVTLDALSHFGKTDSHFSGSCF